MAVQRDSHPSADVLKAFGLGKLDDGSSSVVMGHLDQCPECRKQVSALSGDDFLNRLRHDKSVSGTPAPNKPLAEVARAAKPAASQPPIPNLPPQLANNPHYEIVRELGRGGMGVVYLAKNKLMDRLEVLKVVNKALLNRPGAVERFLREIRSAAKLNHINVVTAFSAVQQGDLLAFAMEYVEGQDLASVVKSQGPLPIAHACFYIQQAAYGLQHAFEKHMIHRDIKPQNLILAREGRKHIVKVLDFGLAKATREKRDDCGLTSEGQILGTPDYMPPEQSLDAASADIRADIYSLGCTLYYLLAGRAPFSGNSLSAILLAHQLQEAKPLSQVRPEVSKELSAAVSKMMAKSPAQRYQTPLDVVQALAPFVKQGATKSSPQRSEAVVEGKPAVNNAEHEAKKPSEAATPWESLAEDDIASPASPRAVVRRHRPVTAKRTAKNWLRGVVISIGVLLLALLGMWAAGVLKVKTKYGTLVLDNLPPGAEVVVDDQTITLQAGDGKTITITAGETHQLQVKKEGFTVFGQVVEIDAGEQRRIRVTLQPKAAQNHSPPPRPETDTQDKGFVPLFNGKDLTGWMTHPKQPGNWRVEKGILIGSGPAASYLYTERNDYKDFHLRTEARINDGGNSGVLFRSLFGPWIPQENPRFPLSYEAQINSTHGDINKTGSLYGPTALVSVRESPVPPGKWFLMEVIAEGNHIVIRVNDNSTADFIDKKRTFSSGHIALQQHNPRTVAEFRKIEIKELPTR